MGVFTLHSFTLHLFISAFTGACVVTLHPVPAAHGAMPPSVPTGLEVEAGERLFRVEHAVGSCEPIRRGKQNVWTEGEFAKHDQNVSRSDSSKSPLGHGSTNSPRRFICMRVTVTPCPSF